jgi:hypothetical protein
MVQLKLIKFKKIIFKIIIYTSYLPRCLIVYNRRNIEILKEC